MTGVRIVRVVQKLCAGLDCPLRFCDETVTLDKSAMSTHSTARLSFVTPRHVRTATCQCEGRAIASCTYDLVRENALLRVICLNFRWQMSSPEQYV